MAWNSLRFKASFKFLSPSIISMINDVAHILPTSSRLNRNGMTRSFKKVILWTENQLQGVKELAHSEQNAINTDAVFGTLNGLLSRISMKSILALNQLTWNHHSRYKILPFIFHLSFSQSSSSSSAKHYSINFHGE